MKNIRNSRSYKFLPPKAISREKVSLHKLNLFSNLTECRFLERFILELNGLEDHMIIWWLRIFSAISLLIMQKHSKNTTDYAGQFNFKRSNNQHVEPFLLDLYFNRFFKVNTIVINSKLYRVPNRPSCKGGKCSKETVVRRWERITGWFSFINWVDNVNLVIVKSFKADVSSVSYSSER